MSDKASLNQEDRHSADQRYKGFILPATGLILWNLVLFIFLLDVNFLFGVDGYYHVAVAEKMTIHGFFMDRFPWATESVWADNYFDKEWLFHVIIALFIPAGKIMAGKLAIFFFNSCLFLAIWHFFRSAGFRYSWLWMLFLAFSSYGWLWDRLTLCRPHILSIVLLVLSLAFIFKRRPILLALTSALYALSYTGHWQMLFLVVVYDLFYIFTDDSGQLRKASWKECPMFLPLLTGMLAGECIHPNFPANLNGLWMQNVMVLKSYWDSGSSLLTIMRPKELDPLPVSTFILQFIPILAALLLMCILFFRRKAEINRTLMILLFYTGVYLVLALKSQRFLEYFIPVAVLTIAMFFETNRVFITNHSKATATAGILVIIFGLIGLTNIYNRQVIALRQQLSDYPLAMDAAQELQRHLKPGDIVFTQSWSDPPALFFNAPEFYYLNFLDPYFMYHRNPEKFTIWQRVKAGESENPLREIQRQFNARAVFIRALPQDYISKLEAQLTEQLGHGPYKSRQGHKVFILPEKINPPVKSNKQVP